MKLLKRAFLTLIAVVAITFAFTSCSDDDDGKKANLLPAEIVIKDRDGEVAYIYSFEYDSKRRLTQMEESLYKNTETKYYTLTSFFTYAADNKIEKVDVKIISHFNSEEENTYSYNVSYEKDRLKIDGYLNETSDIRVDAKGNIVRYNTYNTFDTRLEEIIQTYKYDSGGNLLRYSWQSCRYYIDEDPVRQFCDNEIIYTYSHDSRRGIFSGLNTPAWVFYIFIHTYNRIISYSVRNNNTFYKINGSKAGELWEYTYNEDNYPDSFNYYYTYGENKSLHYSATIEYIEAK